MLLRTPSAELQRMTGLQGDELRERVEDILRRVSAACGLPG